MFDNDPVPSKTYKLRAPGVSEHAIYFTVVGDTVIQALFVNSKAMESFQWISALMISYTRQLSAGIPVNQIIDDMEQTFDPKGSYINPDGSNEEMHSVVQHLGRLLKRHVDDV